MYLVEGDENGFDSIPHGVYWAIVTLTTVGYGDITPHTVLGRILASLIMVMGYGIIAVPTGIFTMELREAAKAKEARACPNCGTGRNGPRGALLPARREAAPLKETVEKLERVARRGRRGGWQGASERHPGKGLEREGDDANRPFCLAPHGLRYFPPWPALLARSR